MKKTNWITIPDETSKAPPPGKAKSQGASPVNNKLFWGVGFIVLIFATFALLAPSQFSELLKGSLFDTSGVSEEDRKVSLIPEKEEDTDSAMVEDATMTDTSSVTDTTDSEEVESESESDTEAEPASESGSSDSSATVEAEDEAVTISIDPIAAPAEPVDCEDDMTCFLASLTDCKLSSVAFDFEALEEDFSVDLEITGEESDDCVLGVEFLESPVETLVGESFTMKLSKGDYTRQDLEDLFLNLTDLDEANEDTTPQDYKDFLSGNLSADSDTEEASETEEASDETQDDLIEDLKKQIENLQGQREEDKKTLEDLSGVLTGQTDPLHGAAATTVPSSITSTTTIGQPSAVQPGFRANPYRVTVTPQQVLAQNSAGGFQASQYATQPVYTQQVAQANSGQVITSGTTPQTGPSEVLLLTFAVTFLGLLGWRFIRTFA